MLRTTYEVRCGERLVSLQNTNTAKDAVVAYLRSMGCRDHEMTMMSASAVDWDGVVFRAVPLGSD